MNDNNINRTTNDYNNENDSDSMKKTICSTPTRCVKKSELNAGEIQEKIDALNLHYDQFAEESSHELNQNKEKLENKIFSSDVKDFIESETSQNYIENEEDESININELLFKSIKKTPQAPHRNLIEIPAGKENTSTNNLSIKDPESNLKIDVEVRNANANLSVNVNNATIEEKKPSSSNVTHFHHNRISEFEVINQDHYLKPFEGRIKERMEMMNRLVKEIEKNESSLLEFSQGYKKMGFNVDEDGITFREYAPGAKSISLVSIIKLNLIQSK